MANADTGELKAEVEVAEEWYELGERLRRASPGRYRSLVSRIREMVEGQEALADFDHQLVLRARRPSKRYSA